jgi:hypothetical protein
MGPEWGGNGTGFHAVNLGFCPANSQLYLAVAKPPGGDWLAIVTIEHLA